MTDMAYKSTSSFFGFVSEASEVLSSDVGAAASDVGAAASDVGAAASDVSAAASDVGAAASDVGAVVSSAGAVSAGAKNDRVVCQSCHYSCRVLSLSHIPIPLGIYFILPLFCNLRGT